MARHKDFNQYTYHDSYWRQIIAVHLPANADHNAIRLRLKSAACQYEMDTVCGFHSDQSKVQRAKAAKVAKTGEAFLDALSKSAGPGTPETIDAIRRIADDAEHCSKHWNEVIFGDRSAKEKSARHLYIKTIMDIWTRCCGHALDRSGIGKMLDFIEAATRPVLTGADAFGAGDAGRDALGKEVDAIRQKEIPQAR